MFACPPAYFASRKRWGAFALNGFPFLLFVVFFANGALRAAFLWWLLSVADVFYKENWFVVSVVSAVIFVLFLLSGLRMFVRGRR